MLCGEYAMGLVLVSSMIEHLELKHVVSEQDFVESILGLARDRRRCFRHRVVRERIYHRHKGRCFHCDHAVAYQDMEVDHLLPWSLGGRTVEENGVCSCRPCNRRKGKRIW